MLNIIQCLYQHHSIYLNSNYENKLLFFALCWSVRTGLGCLLWPSESLFSVYVHHIQFVSASSHNFPVPALFQDFATRAKASVQKLIQKVGFCGILACASVSQIIQIISDHYSNILHPHSRSCHLNPIVLLTMRLYRH